MVIGAAAIVILPAGCLKITLYVSGPYQLGQHSQTEDSNLNLQNLPNQIFVCKVTNRGEGESKMTPQL